VRGVWLLAVAVAVAVTMTAVACNGSDDGDKAPAIPPDAVAVVGGRPVSKANLNASVAALVRGRREAPDVDDGGGDLREEALATLLEQLWLERETNKLGIQLDEPEVRRKAAAARRAFRTPAAYRRFLGGLTERDLLRQMRAQVLYEQLADHVAGVPGTQQLVAWMRERWTPRTDCLPAYARVPGCEEDRP
jgi:hypothetical protein